jgi:hypothetical protein
LLAEALSRRGKSERRRKFKWISKNLGTPLVDLEDKEALNKILDAELIRKLR